MACYRVSAAAFTKAFPVFIIKIVASGKPTGWCKSRGTVCSADYSAVVGRSSNLFGPKYTQILGLIICILIFYNVTNQ